MIKTILLTLSIVGTGSFIYGIFIPGLFPGLYYTMAGGFILGSTIAIWQEL